MEGWGKDNLSILTLLVCDVNSIDEMSSERAKNRISPRSVEGLSFFYCSWLFCHLKVKATSCFLVFTIFLAHMKVMFS